MAETETKRAFSALPNMFHVAENARNTFVLKVPADTTMDDLANPGALGPCFQRQDIARFDRIEIFGGDEWFAELIVVHADRDKKRVFTRVLTKPVKLTVDASLISKDSLEIKEAPNSRFIVFRGTKNLKEFKSKAEAQAYVASV